MSSIAVVLGHGSGNRRRGRRAAITGKVLTRRRRGHGAKGSPAREFIPVSSVNNVASVAASTSFWSGSGSGFGDDVHAPVPKSGFLWIILCSVTPIYTPSLGGCM